MRNPAPGPWSCGTECRKSFRGCASTGRSNNRLAPPVPMWEADFASYENRDRWDEVRAWLESEAGDLSVLIHPHSTGRRPHPDLTRDDGVALVPLELAHVILACLAGHLKATTVHRCHTICRGCCITNRVLGVDESCIGARDIAAEIALREQQTIAVNDTQANSPWHALPPQSSARSC